MEKAKNESIKRQIKKEIRKLKKRKMVEQVDKKLQAKLQVTKKSYSPLSIRRGSQNEAQFSARRISENTIPRSKYEKQFLPQIKMSTRNVVVNYYNNYTI